MKLDFTMQDARFGALVAFAAVAEERSFTRAAQRLRVSPSAVSQSVRRLERRVGVPLLARTSRRVDVTDAGARLLARATPALAELASTLEAARAEAGEVGGTLRVTAPTIAAGLLPPVLERYLGAHPAARAEVMLEDRLVDLVEQGFDVGVRLEESVPVDMVAVRISRPFRFIVVASPSYLGARGEPRTLRQLASHACIGLRMPTSRTLYRWELERPGRDGRRAVVRPQLPARLVVQGQGFNLAARAAKHGLGLAYVDEPSVADDLARGELRVVLPRYAAHVSGFFLYFPPASRASPQVRAFVAAARAAARERGEAPPEGRG
jgi:DNA-binding transcriptional LysR family regulator